MISCARFMVFTVTFFFAVLESQCLTLAQDEAPAPSEASVNVEEIHDALRELRDGMLDAIAKKDVEAILGYLHEDIVFTVQDGDELVCVRKHAGVRDYMDRLLTGEAPGVKSLELDFHADELTILHGEDTGVAFGNSNDHYMLSDGGEFDLATRWSATLVLDGQQWKVASIHVSSNLFDNPVLAAATGYLLPIFVGALVVGLLIGFVIERVLNKAKA